MPKPSKGFVSLNYRAFCRSPPETGAQGAWFVPFRESRANLAKLKAQERALRAATAINQLARILPVVTTGP
jgi:hypothetical protein